MAALAVGRACILACGAQSPMRATLLHVQRRSRLVDTRQVAEAVGAERSSKQDGACEGCPSRAAMMRTPRPRNCTRVTTNANWLPRTGPHSLARLVEIAVCSIVILFECMQLSVDVRGPLSMRV